MPVARRWKTWQKQSIKDLGKISGHRGKHAMNELLLLGPEVGGGKGPSTIITNHNDIKAGKALFHDVSRLEYRFDGWLGDELMETFPCFIVTESLAETLSSSSLTGLSFDDVLITKSPLFDEVHPGLELPSFRWLRPIGRVEIENGDTAMNWSGHDVCLSQRASLVVTLNCFHLLKNHIIKHCRVHRLANSKG